MSFRLLFTTVLLLSGASTLVLAVFAYRNREIPGALPFAGLSAARAYWAFVCAVRRQVTDPDLRIALLQLQWLAHPMIPLFLFLFGLNYTGNDELMSARTVAVVAAIPTVVVLAAWTNPWHHLLWTDQTIHMVEGMAVLVPTYGPLFWINIVYGYGIEMIAIAVLVRLVYQSDYLYADQSALLLAGIAVPFLANLHEIFIVGSTPAVDYTAVSFAVSGIAFGYAVFRRQLFDLIPATRKLGRNDAITQLDTGIMIVDSDDRVVYANPEAGDIFDREPTAMLGRQAQSFVDEAWLDFEAEDALAEVQRGTRTYEIRTSAITDRSGRELGQTLVFHDVTARKRRERELVTVNELNAVIRGVNQALTSAMSRSGIERAVCDRLADADLYESVCMGDVQTWTGDADGWRVAGAAFQSDSSAITAMDGGLSPPEVEGERIRDAGEAAASGAEQAAAPAVEDADSTWIVVPVIYGRTVYGALGLQVRERDVPERERTVLQELGELVGHAINATESRRLVAAEGGVELTVAVPESADPLVAVTGGTDVRLDVLGIVPAGGSEGHHVFLEVTQGDIETVRDDLAAAGADVSVIHGDEGSGRLDVAVETSMSLAPVCEREAELLRGSVTDGMAKYELLVPSAEEARTLLDRLSAAFPATDLRAKRERDHAFETIDGLPPKYLDDLTDRQREALEVAYRAGYFEWPRDSNAEEIAESMDIASPTLHSHLRKAQQTLLDDVFEERDRTD